MTVRLWDVRSGADARILAEHGSSAAPIAFSADGSTLATGSNDKSIHLWDVRTGKHLKGIYGHEGTVDFIAYSPDGLTITSGNRGYGTICLWDVHTGDCMRTITNHTQGVSSVAYHPDGLTLASNTGFYDDVIHLWDVHTGQKFRTLEGHERRVESLAFSPDGSMLASGGGWNGPTIRLWDVRTARATHALVGHKGRVTSVGFSPDGLTLASGSPDGTILLWDLMRSTTLGVIRRTTIADGTRQLPELSPSATALIPVETALLPNYPNPFNPETWIPYQLGQPSEVVLKIYDVNGQPVRTLALGHQSPGVYRSREQAAYWDGRNQQGETVANGIYFCTLRAGDFTSTRKMLVGK